MLDAGKARADVAALLGVHVGTLRRALNGPDDLREVSGKGNPFPLCTGRKSGLAVTQSAPYILELNRPFLVITIPYMVSIDIISYRAKIARSSGVAANVDRIDIVLSGVDNPTPCQKGGTRSGSAFRDQRSGVWRGNPSALWLVWGAVSCGRTPKLTPRWQDFNPPRRRLGYDPESVQAGGKGPGLG